MLIRSVNGLIILVLALAGCSETSRTVFPVSDTGQAEFSQENVDIILLTPENIRNYRSQQRIWHPDPELSVSPQDWRYLVGVGDVLSITVWDHPELTLPAGPERSQVESGSSVNANGEIFYPYIGQVDAADRTVEDIQNELTRRLGEYIPDPQIEVKVAAFNSQKAIITGAVARPTSVQVSNIPVTLIEAINAAGGLKDSADSRHATIKRDGQTYFVDLSDFLENGHAKSNPILLGGDIVNVPIFHNDIAYILGQISKPGTIKLGADGVTLTEAIAQHGGLSEETADAKGVFVFRSGTEQANFTVLQLDARTPLAFVLATEFALHPQDVVYIVTDPAARWNALIADLLPSISAIRGVQLIGGSDE